MTMLWLFGSISLTNRSGPWGPLPVCELVGRLFCYSAKPIKQNQQSVRNSKSITPAEGATSKRESGHACRITWSGQRVSNPRPQAWEACALPTELCPLIRTFKVFETCPENSKKMPEAKLSMKLTDLIVKSSKINLRCTLNRIGYTAHGTRLKTFQSRFLVFHAPCALYSAPSLSLTRETGGHKISGMRDSLLPADSPIAKKVSSFGRGFGPRFSESV